MTDIASARDGRLPIAQPASRNDCETADVIGLRVAASQRRASSPSREPERQHCRGRGRDGCWSAANLGRMDDTAALGGLSSRLGRRFSAFGGLWAAGRGDLWADPLEIRSEWYSSTAPIAANYLTSRRSATT